MNWNNTSPEGYYNNTSSYNPMISFCVTKTVQWGWQYNGNYNLYVRKAGRYGLANELRSNPTFQTFIMPFILGYADGLKEDTIKSIIQGAIDPEQDVLDILVGAFLDAVGYKKRGNELIEWGLAALVVAGAIYFGTRKK